MSRRKRPPGDIDNAQGAVQRSTVTTGATASPPISSNLDGAAVRSKTPRLIENPWIALVLLPVLTTLLGVLAALYLDDWRASREQKDRAIGLLQIAGQECDAIIGTLEGVQIQQQPVFVPSLGIALLNIQQDAASLNVIPASDFRDLVQQLVGIQSTLSDYGRLANDYRFLAMQVPRGAPPAILPMPNGPPKPETPEEARERFTKAMEELETMRQTHLEHMRQTLQSYKNAVKGFCAVGARIRDQLTG
ncbi:hypothetical protein NKI15_02955 [Mesorhizobium sp. M0862]|uniref:hypothetical protein n=1 Tax=Mesorhizobium sp. M0862 TaxID=2957015 RepID=UPI00333561FA